MENNNFAVFILTHGRPNNVKTYETLKKCNYTGRIYFIVDNEDKTVNEYQKKFGNENVIVFDKKAMADKIDEGDNFDNRKVITHARNASFEIAEKLGITYFVQLDDDFTDFHFRFPNKENTKLLHKKVDNINYIFSIFIDFYKKTNFLSIAFAQGGDFIGGVGNVYVQKRPLMRKCMNSFFCSTLRPFKFVGSVNEDVSTYTTLGSRGNLFGTIPMVNLVQLPSQQQKSGVTDWYIKYGTYLKSFMTVMMQPSSVKVSMMNTSNPRIHHKINWAHTTPLILDEKWKKIT